MTTADLSPGQLAQIACVLEATARKPGNVHPGRSFADTHYLDFVLSASAIAGPLDRARTLGVGASVLQAVEATRRVVATNTNLGMILLLAPLAAVPDSTPLRRGVATELEATTRDDARLVYRAIRLARPGGLGRASGQDITNDPTVTLLEAMRLAADRDLIARQYANGFADVFDFAVPTLRYFLANGHALETSIIAAYLCTMAVRPDTLIARKCGPDRAHESARRAAEVLSSGWPETKDGIKLFNTFDEWLRADGNSRNPGATADLMAAALFAALRDGTIKLPLSGGPANWGED